MPKSLRKVLIIRFSSLGDVVLTSLLIRCLHKQTGCEIHYLTKKSFQSLVEANPYVHKVWVLEHSLDEMVPLLKKEKYDLLIDLHKNLRSLYLKCRLWPTPSVTYHKGNISKWLSVHFKINRFSREHIALRYLHSLSPYKIKDDGDGLDFFIPDKDRVHLANWNIPTSYVALVIGAAHYTKRIPALKLEELIFNLKTRYTIVLVGGKAEQPVAKALEQEGVINTCGLLNINQSASLLQQAHTVLAPDTGMMHIAAALKKPIRSIWGSTLAAFGFWPFYGNNHSDLNISFEVPDLACRPCARFGRPSCPQGHFKCMMLQQFQDMKIG